MGVMERVTGRGDPLAQVEREIARHAREVSQAATELEGARAIHDSLNGSGAADGEIDKAARAVVLAERRVVRAKLRSDALAAERAAAAAQARVQLEKRLLGDALTAGKAHAEKAIAAAASAADYLSRKFELENAGFHQTAASLPSLVIYVLDLSDSVGPHAVARPIHPLVERFAFDLETLARASAS